MLVMPINEYRSIQNGGHGDDHKGNGVHKMFKIMTIAMKMITTKTIMMKTDIIMTIKKITINANSNDSNFIEDNIARHKNDTSDITDHDVCQPQNNDSIQQTDNDFSRNCVMPSY